MTRSARVLLGAIALTLLAAPAAASAHPGHSHDPTTVTVMTRNIYLGGNIFGPIGAPTIEEFERKTGELWAEVQSTNFARRAKLLAGEVERTTPDLIGLQEVALWRRSPDGVKDGQTTPSRQVVYDFLRILRRELRRRGQIYDIGIQQQEADIEAPTDAGFDVRLTMYDVILVRRRSDLRITKRLSRNYNTDISVPTPSSTLTSTRGWTAVDVAFEGKRFRFVNTHLEAAGDAPREAQARELVSRSGPLRGRRRLIVVGDMNSDPEGRESPAGAFKILADFGLVDAWPTIHRRKPGFSCCLEQSDARDPDRAGWDHRIDLILTKPRLRGVAGEVVGDQLADRAGGLWPSDHAGVVITFRLP